MHGAHFPIYCIFNMFCLSNNVASLLAVFLNMVYAIAVVYVGVIVTRMDKQEQAAVKLVNNEHSNIDNTNKFDDFGQVPVLAATDTIELTTLHKTLDHSLEPELEDFNPNSSYGSVIRVIRVGRVARPDEKRASS